MGVIDRDGNVNSNVLAVLAKTFAYNFYDELSDSYNSGADNIPTTIQGVFDLLTNAEIKGLYYFVVLSCGMINYEPPLELYWIACHEDALTDYLQIFAETLLGLVSEEDKRTDENDDVNNEEEKEPLTENEEVCQ